MARSKLRFAVRGTHATSGDYSKIRPRGELDGFCGVPSRLEPKDIDADRDRLRLLIDAQEVLM